jgi:hypothetical protein
VSSVTPIRPPSEGGEDGQPSFTLSLVLDEVEAMADLLFNAADNRGRACTISDETLMVIAHAIDNRMLDAKKALKALEAQLEALT